MAEHGRVALTLEALMQWEESGATWQALEVNDERAVVELRTCYGEAVDQLQGDSPELIAFLQSRRAG